MLNFYWALTLILLLPSAFSRQLKSQKTGKAAKAAKSPGVRAFYSTSPSRLSLSVNDKIDEGGEIPKPIDGLAGEFPLGVVETSAVVSVSVSTRILIDFEEYDADFTVAGVGSIYLQILAFQGCNSTVSCSKVTPTTFLAPGDLPVVRISSEFRVGNDDSSTTLAFASTDTLQYVFAAPNSEDYFLVAVFVIDGLTDISSADQEVRRRKLEETKVDLWVDQLVAVITPAQALDITTSA